MSRHAGLWAGTLALSLLLAPPAHAADVHILSSGLRSPMEHAAPVRLSLDTQPTTSGPTAGADWQPLSRDALLLLGIGATVALVLAVVVVRSGQPTGSGWFT